MFQKVFIPRQHIISIGLTTDIVYIVWSMFLVLLALNVLDFSTTWVALSLCERMGPVQGYTPIWKATRLGRWIRGRWIFKWIKPPVSGPVYWYDHELNPVARGLCKRMGLQGLTVLKVLPLSLVTLDIWAATSLGVLSWHMLVVLYILIDIYAHVVWHNYGVVAKIENQYIGWKNAHKVRIKKAEKFEDPLLPI